MSNSNPLGLPDSVARGTTPDVVRQAITEHPQEAAEFLSAHFPAVMAYEELKEQRERALAALRQPTEGMTEAVQQQSALARKNAMLVLSMVTDGDFDALSPGEKQTAMVELMIAADTLERAAYLVKKAANEILSRNTPQREDI